jgi:tetratricopeptide (TPR) repeat protein
MWKSTKAGLAAFGAVLLLISSAHAQDATAIVTEAKRLLRAGDAAATVRLLEPLAAVSPEDVEVHAVLGIAKNELKDYAGAAAALERAKALDPETPEIRNQLGLSYAEMGDFARALPELEYVFGKAADTPDVGYRLGYIHYSETRYPPARDTLADNRPSNRQIEQRVYYLLGLTYERLGNRAESEKNLRKSIQVDPATELAKKITAILDEDGAPKTVARGSAGEQSPTAPVKTRRRKLGVDAYLSVLYDDNARLDPKPSLEPVAAFLRTRPGQRDSQGFNVAVRPEYSFHESERTRASVSYSGSHTEYFDVPGVDFSNHQLALNLFRRESLEGAPLVSAQLAYDTSVLDTSEFLQRYTFAPSITWQNGLKHGTVLYGLVQRRDFAVDPVTVPQEVRDGNLFSGGVTHYRFFGEGRHNVRGGVLLDRDDTDGADYAYVGFRPSIGGSATFGEDLVLSFDALHHRREYDNANAVFGGVRRDADTLLLARLSKPFASGITGFTEFAHNDVHSNIPVFEYQRDVVSAGLHYRY